MTREQMLDSRGGGAEDRSGRGTDFGSSGPMEKTESGGGSLKEEIDDEIPF